MSPIKKFHRRGGDSNPGRLRNASSALPLYDTKRRRGKQQEAEEKQRREEGEDVSHLDMGSIYKWPGWIKLCDASVATAILQELMQYICCKICIGQALDNYS